MKKLLIFGGILVLMGALVWVGLSGGSQAKGTEVYAATVTRGPFAKTVTVTGNLRPLTRIKISSSVIGEIRALPVASGDQIRQGDVLVRLDDARYVAAEDQAQAALERARLAYQRDQLRQADAQREQDRLIALFDQGLAPRRDLDQARLTAATLDLQVAELEKEVRQAAARLAEAQDDLARTVIRSPLDGWVVAVYAEEGEQVLTGTMNNPGTVILELADLRALLVEARVNEREFLALAVGQRATITLEALPDVTFDGSLEQLANTAELQGDSADFPILVQVLEPEPRLKLGMSAEVTIYVEERKDVLWVPIQAVLEREVEAAPDADPAADGPVTEDVVFVVENGKAVRRAVTKGLVNEDAVEVQDGLEEGALAITGPYRALRGLADGDPVSVEEEEGPAAGTGA